MMECSFVAFRESHQYLFLQLASFCSLHCLRSTASDRELQWRKKRAKSLALIPSQRKLSCQCRISQQSGKVGTSSPSDALKGICNGRCVVAFVAFCMTAGFRRTGFPRCIFLSDGKGSVGLTAPLWRTLSHLSWWIQRRWRKGFFFFSVRRNGGGDSEFSLFYGWSFFFFLRCFLENLLEHHRSAATHCFLK